MNQPIIVKYLQYLDSIGTKGLFGKKNIDYITQDFFGNPEQLEYFNDFLKYSKMAEQLFNLTQATNYDTTRLSSNDTLWKKQLRTIDAEENNIFSSAKAMIDKSFLKDQVNLLDSTGEAIGEILKLEQDKFRNITDTVLEPYATDPYLSADNFDKISNKVKASFLDYIIQTGAGLNDEIKSLLVDASTSVANQLAVAQKNHPEMAILKDLQVVGTNRPDGTKTVKLKANVKEAYDENLYTGYMRELRDNPDTNELYNNLVKLSIIQGTYQSAVSIKNIIPIEDYSAIVKPIIDTVVADKRMDAFSQGLFQRNNWKDRSVFGKHSPKFFTTSQIPSVDQYGNDVYTYYSPAFPNIPEFNSKSKDRKVMLVSEKYNSADIEKDFLLVDRVVTDKNTGDRIDIKTGMQVRNSDYARRKAMGDMSLYDVYGYQKVKFEDGTPLTIVDSKGSTQHVYKLINLVGDGQYASEYYEDYRPSVLNNGTVKIDEEIPNADIITYYAPGVKENVVSSQSSITNVNANTTEPKGQKVKEGIYVNQEALTKDEQMELFNYLKPYLESQASKTNKGANASKMIGLGLRWDYKVNNPGRETKNIPDVINPGNKNKYGYYDTSINNQPLAPISNRFRELMEKATGVDMTNYDGAIINLYDANTFISAHNDVDESRSAIGYPVIGINLGGTGNFSIESRDGNPKQLNLKAGSGYVFGLDSINREVFHRTFPKPQDSFLPELTTDLDGKIYEPGSYRVTITMRRVMPLEPGMPTKPAIVSQQIVEPTQKTENWEEENNDCPIPF
jgi:hypothetical protein